jgi:hypothetical protein
MAAQLFSGLRLLDHLGVDAILTHLPGEAGLGQAVRNRLLKAAERVVPAEG